MPLSQNPIVEWPAELQQLLEGIQVGVSVDGKRQGHVEVDVDRETLFVLNDFEARVRNRQVRIRQADSPACLVGEMNVLIGLGAAADPRQHVGKVRISFHDIQDDSCVDPEPEA